MRRLFPLIIATPALASPTFSVTFNEADFSFTAAEKAALSGHFIEAGRLWAERIDLTSDSSIEIQITANNAFPRMTGRSFTSSFAGTFAGRNIFEQGMAAELRTGTDPNGSDPDVDITVSAGYLRNELWLDPDPASRTAAVPTNRTDAMSVAIHEIGHAIAYNGWADLSTGTPPETFYSTFDRWITPTTEGIPLPVFAGPAVLGVRETAPDLTVGNIHHWANPVARASSSSTPDLDDAVPDPTHYPTHYPTHN
ncbi:MAG: hypothetical protein AAF297_12565, partial [Planctomycetota bacterium]